MTTDKAFEDMREFVPSPKFRRPDGSLDWQAAELAYWWKMAISKMCAFNPWENLNRGKVLKLAALSGAPFYQQPDFADFHQQAAAYLSAGHETWVKAKKEVPRIVSPQAIRMALSMFKIGQQIKEGGVPSSVPGVRLKVVK